MITATTESAIRTLVFLCQAGEERPVSPRQVAKLLGGSPTYTAKITGLLTRAGILKARRGVAGGILLARKPADISLLDIVQACQGLVTADYCKALGDATSPEVCAFHQAMFELHAATVRTLSKWSLKMLSAKPLPRGGLTDNMQCRMFGLAAACDTCGYSTAIDALERPRSAGGRIQK